MNESTDDPPNPPEAADTAELNKLLGEHRDRLTRMVRMRMDARVRGRVDASDVIQEAFIEVARRIDDYRNDPKLPFFLWLRLVAGQKLTLAHRQHLGVQARDAARELSLFSSPVPEASSAVLAARLVGEMSSPSQQVERAELKLRVQEALNQMSAMDREILSLRHFEQLSNQEAATELGIQASTACNRYIRALERLRSVFNS